MTHILSYVGVKLEEYTVNSFECKVNAKISLHIYVIIFYENKYITNI